MERECLQWQARSEAHRLAFERCTATWDDMRGLSLSTAYAALPAAVQSPQSPHSAPSGSLASAALRSTAAKRRSRWAAAFAVAALLVVAFGVLFSTQRGISTSIGERRVVILDDGSRVTLNTDTRVLVDFSATQRTVSLDRGEALFEVARDVGRPFVVRAARGEVVAIGTVFSVRRTGDALAITLIEGEVAVRHPATDAGQSPAQRVTIRPGERVNVDLRRPNAPARVDKPRIEQVTAWKRGEAAFDDVPLDEAVAEMNRYSRVHIVLADDSLSTRRVSGVFHTGDNLAFAQAVAALHGLAVDDQKERLRLTRKSAD